MIIMQAKYSRVLLKLSGEALAGDRHFGINDEVVRRICTSVKKCADMGVQIGIVVGGGNFWRGRTSEGMDRTRADHIGMLATLMNALAVGDMLEQLGCDVRVQTAIQMDTVAEPYINPFCSTDLAAALRAAEIEAEVIFKATMVDGVYDSDPKKNPDAKKFDTISFEEVLIRNLQVMDSTAAAMCRENKIPIQVYNLQRPDDMVRAMAGENVGTLVTP